MTSIIHISKDNLGANYKNTQYLKDNFYSSTTTNKMKQEKNWMGRGKAVIKQLVL